MKPIIYYRLQITLTWFRMPLNQLWGLELIATEAEESELAGKECLNARDVWVESNGSR